MTEKASPLTHISDDYYGKKSTTISGPSGPFQEYNWCTSSRWNQGTLSSVKKKESKICEILNNQKIDLTLMHM